VFGRRHERQVQELEVVVGQHLGAITASGAVMTLPEATADLLDWVADERAFRPAQGDDWLQVIDDFRESLNTSGPKLRAVVNSVTGSVQPLLGQLISIAPAPDGSPIHAIDASVRATLLPMLHQLASELATEAAIRAAWLDLLSTSEKTHRAVEELMFRRDTLWSIAARRDLDLGRFGIFWDMRAVITDNPDAVQQELDTAAGVDHQPVPLTDEPTGQATWQRLKMCEEMLAKPAQRADCVVWLRLAPTSLPQWEVTHGQVTFYNADYLSSFIGHPELADRFTVAPTEVLDPSVDPPILVHDEVEWEPNYHMAYARVLLPDTVVHTAPDKARALVEALKSIHHANPDTWRILNGSILFIDGRRSSPLSWGPKEGTPEPFCAENDWMGQDIERMAVRNQTLDPQSMDELQQAIHLSMALKEAAGMNPQMIIMAAVRAIEHVNARTTRGVPHWADFASEYFKKAQSRIKIVEFIGRYTRAAVDNSPGLPRSDPRNKELHEINSKLQVREWPHQMFNARAAADHVPALRRIYADHWLVRGLGELETILATPAGMYSRLEEQGRRFDRHLGRLKRLRNSVIHGGPVSDSACASVSTFAYNLGHQCLNEVMKAILIGRDIPSHMTDYRADHIDRYERARTTGDIDALFVAWT
jgi:hypothetical protein